MDGIFVEKIGPKELAIWLEITVNMNLSGEFVIARAVFGNLLKWLMGKSGVTAWHYSHDPPVDICNRSYSCSDCRRRGRWV
jgi:hypothetical protein